MNVTAGVVVSEVVGEEWRRVVPGGMVCVDLVSAGGGHIDL